MAKTNLWAGHGHLLRHSTQDFARHESLATCENLTTMTSIDAQCDDLIVRDYQAVTLGTKVSRVSWSGDLINRGCTNNVSGVESTSQNRRSAALSMSPSSKVFKLVRLSQQVMIASDSKWLQRHVLNCPLSVHRNTPSIIHARTCTVLCS